ncbi:UNVERIFIED_CONTAM: hypothetical protein FKN15_049334 [Acipenser sinensis]
MLCPRYLVLGASAPQCLDLDACGTLGSSVLQSLSASPPSVHKSLDDSVPQRPWYSSASRHQWLHAPVLYSLGASASLVPRGLAALALQRLRRFTQHT